jgi:hypothetical protein
MTKVHLEPPEDDPPAGEFSRPRDNLPSGQSLKVALTGALAAAVIYVLAADSWTPWCRLLAGVIVIILVIPEYRLASRSLGQYLT